MAVKNEVGDLCACGEDERQWPQQRWMDDSLLRVGLTRWLLSESVEDLGRQSTPYYVNVVTHLDDVSITASCEVR